MKEKKIILWFIIVVFVLLILWYLAYNSKSEKLWKATEQQVIIFNKIINSASNNSDIENCSDIWNIELESICKSQLENRFSPLYWADNLSICKTENDELKQDMCILDLSYNKAKSSSETWLCNEIKNQDIKDACFAQIMNKKF
jgi:hypothetical protein